MTLPPICYMDLIHRALAEDINYIDITTDNLIPIDQISNAIFLAKENGILCGIDIAIDVLKTLDPELTFEMLHHDGDKIEKSDIIARVQGKTRALLSGERTALNIVQHLSGISTATSRAVAAVAGTKASVCDTRKTIPGMRVLEKYAVKVGGGKNHRFNLSDAALIKDNHIDAVGSIKTAVETMRKNAGHTIKIEVETRTVEEFTQALEAGADIIMLDNMTNKTMRLCVGIGGGKVLLEASGGVTEDRLHEIAETGVDLISIGALTHSVKALDISMKII